MVPTIVPVGAATLLVRVVELPAIGICVAVSPEIPPLLIEAQTGGIDGGGATLTPLGRKLVQRYHAIEVAALAATQKHLHNLEGVLKRTKMSGLHNSIRRPIGTAAASS